jgi:hypothetical protein
MRGQTPDPPEFLALVKELRRIVRPKKQGKRLVGTAGKRVVNIVRSARGVRVSARLCLTFDQPVSGVEFDLSFEVPDCAS